MARVRASDGTWGPAEGSYEEAVLSWQEQIEASFRRRESTVQKSAPPLRETDKSTGRTALTGAP